MKRITAVLALLVAMAGAGALFAQQATLAAPVTRSSEDNYRVESYYGTRDAGGRWEIIVSVNDSGGVEIRRVSFTGPDAAHATATAAAFNSALITARASETGTDARKANFRLLGFLKDQGYVPVATSTLVP